MSSKKTISVRQLRLNSEFGAQQFKSTAELADIDYEFSQPRVTEAMRYALEVKQPGYNLYVAGPYGLGKPEIVASVLSNLAGHYDAPKEWCFVHNFYNGIHPYALCFDPGAGNLFKTAISDCLVKLKELVASHANQKLMLAQVSQWIADLLKKYDDPYITNYLLQFKKNITIDLGQYFKHDIEVSFWKYQVNLIVQHHDTRNPHVVYEPNPTLSNLFGKIGSQTIQGTVISNFTMLSGGSLHDANGGILIIDAHKLFQKTETWEALKRALSAKEINMAAELTSSDTVNTATVKPKPIPLEIKIILMGDRSLYYLVCEEEPEFTTLFKVIADCDDSIIKNTRNNFAYARLLASLIRKNNLRHLSKLAVKEVMKFSSKELEDSKRLSLDLNFLTDLLIESSYHAENSGHLIVKKTDVELAYTKRQARRSRMLLQMLEDMQRKYILIDVKSSKVGQVNGLTVDTMGDISYGHPVRITAVARIGRSSDIINIDREVDLSGAIHSKGVLILSGYLRGKYLLTQSLSISASLVFEQTYEGVDGDSASVAELLALLSAIAEIPIDQSIAITGSVNQHGEVQAVSGINEKIESFFDVCKASGLNGTHGVMIPESNIQNVVLREDVRKAIAKRDFNLYAIKMVDEAIPILTGLPAGRRSKYGYFPQDSFNLLVEERLKEFTKEIIEEKSPD